MDKYAGVLRDPGLMMVSKAARLLDADMYFWRGLCRGGRSSLTIETAGRSIDLARHARTTVCSISIHSVRVVAGIYV